MKEMPSRPLIWDVDSGMANKAAVNVKRRKLQIRGGEKRCAEKEIKSPSIKRHKTTSDETVKERIEWRQKESSERYVERRRKVLEKEQREKRRRGHKIERKESTRNKSYWQETFARMAQRNYERNGERIVLENQDSEDKEIDNQRNF